MTESKCIAPELGRLLHAFELGALNEEEHEQFSIHLMKCEYCFQKALEFREAAVYLRSSDNIRKLVAEESSDRKSSKAIGARLINYLWPRSSALKPAWLVLLIIVLIYPAYLGLFGTKPASITPVGTLYLNPLRSATEVVSQPLPRNGMVISFAYLDAVPGLNYEVSMLRSDSTLIFMDKAYSAFDTNGVGSIYVPGNTLGKGDYLLKISEPVADSAQKPITYRFMLK